MKKVLAVFLAVLIAVTAAPVGLAYTTEAYQAASHLNQLGLFSGKGTNPDGTPNYDLDTKPTRAEGIVMLLALLGEREEANSKEWRSSFTDLPAWGRKYINYAYQKKYTAGESSTRFGSNKPLTSNQYLTFVLKAMGYSSSSDFNWKDPYTLSDQLGITGGKYNSNSRFTRGDMAIISDNALNAKMKGSDQTLYQTLLDAGKLKDPTASANKIQQLVQYVDNHGSTTTGGSIVIQKTLNYDDYQVEVRFSHNSSQKRLYLFCTIPYSDHSNAIGMTINTDTSKVEEYCWYQYSDSTQEYELGASDMNPATYTQNTTLTFRAVTGSSIPASLLPALQAQANRCALISVASWAIYLESIGFSIRDLGFTRFLNTTNPGSTPSPNPTATPSPSPSPTPQATKAEQLGNYITTHGEMDSDGDMTVYAQRPMSNATVDTAISYDKTGGKLYFIGLITPTDNNSKNSVVACYDLARSAFMPSVEFRYTGDNLNLVMMANDLNPSFYQKGSTLKFSQTSGSSVDTASALEQANQVFYYCMLAWTLQLQEYGFAIGDFGFTRFVSSVSAAASYSASASSLTLGSAIYKEELDLTHNPSGEG